MAANNGLVQKRAASAAVALLQLRCPEAERSRSLRAGERACCEAAALGAEIALFPETWSVGYQPPPADEAGRQAWLEQAEPTDGPYVERYRELARELGLVICLTYLEQKDGTPRNSASVIDRDGRIVFTYAKVHTCDFDWEIELAPGDGFPTGTVELAGGSVDLGVMICFDREFPESARCLMLGGAEIILTPNACSLPRPRIEQFRTRAMENMVGLAMANYAKPRAGDPVAEWDGHSLAVMATQPGDSDDWPDPTIVEANEREGIHLAEFDLDRLREIRRYEGWGDAYRKPRRYSALVAETEPLPVFRREDSRRTDLGLKEREE